MQIILPSRFVIEGTARLTGTATIERNKNANEM